MPVLDIKWHPDINELRRFGLWITTFAVIASLILFLKGFSYTAFVILAIFSTGGLLAILGKKPGLILYRLWLSISIAMGFIIGPLVLLLIYYLIFTPLGIIMRLGGYNPLMLTKKDKKSYWTDIKQPDSSKCYSRQY